MGTRPSIAALDLVASQRAARTIYIVGGLQMFSACTTWVRGGAVFVGGAVFAVLTVVALQPGTQLPWTEKVAVSAYSLAFYLYKTVAPFGLAALYERRSGLNVLAWPFLASYVAVVALAVFCWFARKRWRGLISSATSLS